MTPRRVAFTALPLSVLAAGFFFPRHSLPQSATGVARPLALKGYDPVAYFTDGRPVQGSDTYEFAWDGQLYRFANAEHLDLFKANPDKYAPQFGGLCTMNLAAGVRREADPRNWVISDGNLYVFAGPTGPANFSKDPRGNAARAGATLQRLKAAQ